MDRRTVTGSLCSTALAGGIAALIGAASLHESSPYLSVLIAAGLAGVLAGLGGLGGLLPFPAASAATQPVKLLDDTPPPSGLSDKERALFLLKRGRDNAVAAKKMWGDNAARLAYNELIAATLSVKREFGFGTVTIKSDCVVPWKTFLDIYIRYIDSIYALLREGHIEQARNKPNMFTLTQG